jgi:adenosine kinase
VDTSLVTWVEDHYTAQAIIITETDNNQITAFHPGAMQKAGEVQVPERADLKVAIIAPDGRDAMMRHARQLQEARIPFGFDPGQGLPMFDGAELKEFIAQSTWVAVNDYEAKMLCDRTGHTLESLSTSHLKGVIVTLGAQGCDIWVQGRKEHVPGVAAHEVLDPTGCGDAFRGALLYGLERGWSLQRCVALGNRLGAAKIACRGGQNHLVDPAWAQG